MYLQIKNYQRTVTKYLTMKKLFGLFIALLLSLSVFSQGNKKKIYLLVDTLNQPKIDKQIEIKWTSPFHYAFIFNVPYKAPYYKYVEFSTWIDKKKPKPQIELSKPKYPFIELAELLSKVKESPLYFSDEFDFYITEALPKKRFQTFKVMLMPQQAPTQTGASLKNK